MSTPELLGCRSQEGIGKRRHFQNDALIASTVRRHGATIITANCEMGCPALVIVAEVNASCSRSHELAVRALGVGRT